MVQIKVTNWDKYNPKRAQDTYTWLRLDNQIGFDAKLFGLSPAQKYVWILILCQCSRDNTGETMVDIGHLEHFSGVDSDDIERTLSHLIERGIIAVTTADYRALPPTTARCSAPPPPTTPTDGRTDERKSSSKSSPDASQDSPVIPEVKKPGGPVQSAIERAYQGFPRKQGKSKGIKIARREIKTEQDAEALVRAIGHYRAYCARSALEPQFIKLFSTFMSEWRDWLDPSCGKVIEISYGRPM